MSASPLSCSSCGLPTYVRGTTSDVRCEMCGNEVNFSDFQLDRHEFVEFDDSDEGDGYLYVDSIEPYGYAEAEEI